MAEVKIDYVSPRISTKALKERGYDESVRQTEKTGTTKKVKKEKKKKDWIKSFMNKRMAFKSSKQEPTQTIRLPKPEFASSELSRNLMEKEKQVMRKNILAWN